MRKFLIAGLFAGVLWAGAALAAGDKIIVHVNGMVCDFCAQSITKVFEDKHGEAVDAVDISLEDSTVTLKLKDGKTLSDEDIEGVIYYAGYDTIEIER